MSEKSSKNQYSWPKWADLPDELLFKICNCFKYSHQVGHFRAVCTSWRSAVPPPNRSLPCTLFNYTQTSAPKDKNLHTTVSKYIRRFVFRLELQQLPNSPSTTSYLIAVEEGSGGQLRLLNPITGTPMPSSLPRLIHLNKFRVSVLHKSSLIWVTYKVVFLSPRGRIKGRNKKIAAVLRKSGKLNLHMAEKGVKVCLNEMMDRLLRDHNLDRPVYHDVVKYKDKWFTVDQYGRGVMLDSSLNVNLVTNPLFLPNRSDGYFGNHKSYLVKSSGDEGLFLVDRYLDKSSERTDQVENSETLGATSEIAYDMVVRFRVYKLDEEEHSWKEVTSLNDQIIFVGDDASFWSYCVSANDFLGCRGNFIFFTINSGELKMGIFMILRMS